MAVEVLGVATALPPNQFEQDAALAMAHDLCCRDERERRFASTLYKHSGVESRYFVLPPTEAYRWAPTPEQLASGAVYSGPTTEQRMAYYQQYALPLACEAATKALQKAECPAGDITHVVTVSCTGFSAPGVDSGLIEQLALRRTTERVHVGYMGCHGAINALRVAHGLALSGEQARILVCATELCSLHYTFFWDTERMLGNALFADGAGAMVIGAAGDREHEGAARHWRVTATGSYLFHETAGAMTWNVGNHGFSMTISSQLPKLIRANLAGWLHAWLDRQGLTIADVRSWAVHPGGPKILDAVESAMGLTSQQTTVSREILAKCGNMSSATLLFILEALMQAGASPPCVLLGFGPGLVAEAALLT